MTTPISSNIDAPEHMFSSEDYVFAGETDCTIDSINNRICADINIISLLTGVNENNKEIHHLSGNDATYLLRIAGSNGSSVIEIKNGSIKIQSTEFVEIQSPKISLDCEEFNLSASKSIAIISPFVEIEGVEHLEIKERGNIIIP